MAVRTWRSDMTVSEFLRTLTVHDENPKKRHKTHLRHHNTPYEKKDVHRPGIEPRSVRPISRHGER